MRPYVKRVIDWMDCSPRKGWYIAFLLLLNFIWDVVGHWPL